jgi:hypothetical protein
VDTDVEDHAPDALRYGLMAERQWAKSQEASFTPFVVQRGPVVGFTPFRR